MVYTPGYPLHRENRENGQNKSCQGKHREFGNFAKTHGKYRELVCSSCKFPDSKGKRYFDICRENFHFLVVLDKSVLCM